MATYKVEVDREACIGDKLCCEEAPATFVMDDEDKCKVVSQEGDTPDRILSAAKTCPVDCIKLTECTSGKVVWPQ